MADVVVANAPMRPVRKGAGKRQVNPNFVNSISAIQDPMGDLIEENKELFSGTSRKNGRKRKRLRSPSPVPPPLSPVDCFTENDFSTLENSPMPETVEPHYQPLQLTFNIPSGFQGPLKIELDPSQLVRLVTTVPDHQPRSTAVESRRFKRAKLFKDVKEPELAGKSLKSKTHRHWVKKYGAPPRGFLDLPAELRNDIYRQVFVTGDPIDFGSTNNCHLSASFLRTCRQVHSEAIGVLYGENRFVFRRNKSTRSPFWVMNPKEVGYLDMRHFLSMIGLSSRQLLRRVHIILEDANKNHSLQLPDSDGRFTHDGNLLACFKTMAKDCYLKNLALTFYGRRNVSILDVRFLENLCAIEIDRLIFNPQNAWTGDKIDSRARETLAKEMERPEPLYDPDKPSAKPPKRVGYGHFISW